MTKKHLLGLGAIVCSLTMLASCDKVEAELNSDIADQKILDINDQIDANTLKDIYDALITSGNTNSEKVLNNILYLYSQSLFGEFIGEGNEKGLKDVASAYIADNTKTTDLDNFIAKHSALQVKKGGALDAAASRVRAINLYKDILYRVYDTFLGYVTNTSYQERTLFNEEKFYDAQLKNYYTLGDDYNDLFVQVEGDMYIDEENPGDDTDGLNNVTLNKYFKDIWGTYSDYIELNILPDIYRSELTTEYMYTQNDAQINLTAAREVEYITLATNAQYTDAVLKLMRQYSAKVIEKGKMDDYGFDFLSALYKGATDEYNATSPSTDAGKLAKEIYSAANWTPATITVSGSTVNYYKESSFGTICEKYATLLGQTSRDDSNWSSVYSDFTNSGSYSKETGFNVKKQSLIAEGHTTRGWYTSGGLGSLPSSLSTRIFKAAVANEVDSQDLKNETGAHTYKGGDGTFGRYIEDKYFLTPAAYSEVNNYPYIVEDGDNYTIVLVKEATKSAKFADDGIYGQRGSLENEKIARKVAYSLSSIDTWKSDAKTYYVQQMAVMYHDDYVYEYFKSQFPDLFD